MLPKFLTGKPWLIFCFTVLWLLAVYGQSANASYIDNSDGTVTDSSTGLMWKRCAEGQTWTGSTCTVNPGRYTWYQAMSLTSTFAGYGDWRMPSINELRSIVNISYYPTIDPVAFPNTVASDFWSGSPVAGNSYGAWYVFFGSGNDHCYSRDDVYAVRLVRGGQCICNLSLCSSDCKPEKNIGSDPSCPNTVPSCEGNPINVSTGNKYEVETDYIGASQTQLSLYRYYNSQDTTLSAFGRNWHSAWHRSLNATSNRVIVTRGDGRRDTFTLNDATWVADPDVMSVLSGNAQTGWMLITSEDTTEKYGPDGWLTSITTRAGLVTTLTYDGSKNLTMVTGPFGHTLKFSYDSANRVSTMTTPDGKIYTYAYDATNNLTSVKYPDATVRQYLYEDVDHPNALTGITDENGNRFATYAYGSDGRAISTQHAGGAELTTVTYNTDGTVSVNDPLGNTHGYDFTVQFGMVKPTAISGAPVKTSGGKSFTYDSNGFIASRTDFDGNVTTYTHDARGLEISRTEASGTPLARTIETKWSPVFHLPIQITEPNRITKFSYDAKGNLKTKMVTANTETRSWNYTYNAKGQVLTINGPRTDVADVTKFAYYVHGGLATITDALGHVTSLSNYDANGHPLKIIDPNGLITRLTYDVRGHIQTRTIGTETTTFAYDAVGNLIKMTRPDGSFLSYTYDAAHRLTGVKDALGNSLAYTLDAADNRTKEQILDATSAVTRTRSYAYDNVNRLIQEIGAQGQTIAYDYDPNGNLTKVTDPLNYATTYSYDALNRLAQTLDPNNGVTIYGYDANDHLTSLTDPRTLKTTYVWNGLDNQPSFTSRHWSILILAIID
ncbi:hypothetical protein CCP3SC1_970006 [Gammaproteobacteria bacterium]